MQTSKVNDTQMMGTNGKISCVHSFQPDDNLQKEILDKNYYIFKLQSLKYQIIYHFKEPSFTNLDVVSMQSQNCT